MVDAGLLQQQSCPPVLARLSRAAEALNRLDAHRPEQRSVHRDESAHDALLHRSLGRPVVTLQLLSEEGRADDLQHRWHSDEGNQRNCEPCSGGVSIRASSVFVCDPTFAWCVRSGQYTCTHRHQAPIRHPHAGCAVTVSRRLQNRCLTTVSNGWLHQGKKSFSKKIWSKPHPAVHAELVLVGPSINK